METKTVTTLTWSEVNRGASPFNPVAFSTMINSYGTALTIEAAALTDSAECSKMMSNYFYPKAWGNDAIATEETDESAQNGEIDLMLCRFASYLISSQPYFKTIIDIYSNQLSRLMDKVTTTHAASTIDNDMPVDKSIAADGHASNVNEMTDTISTDDGTVMTRIDEIRQKLDNTYQRWADEALGKFVLF